MTKKTIIISSVLLVSVLGYFYFSRKPKLDDIWYSNDRFGFTLDGVDRIMNITEEINVRGWIISAKKYNVTNKGYDISLSLKKNSNVIELYNENITF